MFVSLLVSFGVTAAFAQGPPGPGGKPGGGRVSPKWQSSVGQGVTSARSSGGPMLVSVGRSGSQPPAMDVDASGPRGASPEVQAMKRMTFVHMDASDADVETARNMAGGGGAEGASETARALSKYDVDELPAAFLTDRYGNLLQRVSPDELTPEGILAVVSAATRAASDRDREVTSCLEQALAALAAGTVPDKECLERLLKYEGYEEVTSKAREILEQLGGSR